MKKKITMNEITDVLTIKRILVITDNLPSQINGVVTTFTNLKRIASEYNHDIIFIDPSYFWHCPAPGYSDVVLSFPWRIGSKIKMLNPDYIHIATEGPIGLAARFWLKWKKWKYNTSYHTRFPEMLKELYKIPLCISYAYFRWFHKHSCKILTTTDSMVIDLKNNGFTGEILPWTRGVNRTIFNPELRTKITDKKILLNVGRVSKEKGLDDFCQLQIPNTQKIVVGDGPYKTELEKKYKDIEFVGVKTGTELAKYYANADVFVFPSRKDTFGVVIIESLACGTPVAAYPVTGPLDILEFGTNGFMSESLEESVVQCLSYDRQQVTESSKKWTWYHCWEIFKTHLVNIK